MAKKRANGEGNIRKRKDGRWEGRYTAGYDEKTGKRLIKNVLGKTQAEVKEKLAKAVAEAEIIDVRRSDEYTLGTWLQAIRQAASAILDCGILPARYRAAHHATHRRYSAEKIVWTRPAMALLGPTISTLFTGYQSHIENQSMCKPCKILR